MEKVAIVGANSYIARNLLYILKSQSENYQIDLYDYADSHVDGAENYHTINILSKESCKKIDLDCDVVFMFIGKTGTINGFEEYDTFIDINERGLLNLLNEYRNQNSHAKIVFPSTRLVYKGQVGKLSENAEKEFKTIYAINKYACEQYLEQYNRMYGVKYCILRICVPYGTLIPNASSYGTAEFMLNRATGGQNISLYGDGELRRTLTYMGDLCMILIQAGISEHCINDVFNIGGEDYSLKEMAELIAKKYGVKVEYVPWPEATLKIESGDTVFDDSKLQQICDIEYKQKFASWCERY